MTSHEQTYKHEKPFPHTIRWAWSVKDERHTIIGAINGDGIESITFQGDSGSFLGAQTDVICEFLHCVAIHNIHEVIQHQVKLTLRQFCREIESQHWTIAKIQTAVESAGRRYFNPETMKIHDTRVVSPVYQGRGGIFFVVSELRDRQTPQRIALVMVFNPVSKTIATVSHVHRYTSAEDARAVAYYLAMKPGITEVQEHEVD